MTKTLLQMLTGLGGMVSVMWSVGRGVPWYVALLGVFSGGVFFWLVPRKTRDLYPGR